MNDEVNNPKHYTSGKIEALEIIEDATKDLDGLEAFSIGSALKYLIRFDRKTTLFKTCKKQCFILRG